jgi:hypothetical protein
MWCANNYCAIYANEWIYTCNWLKLAFVTPKFS